ncbi:MAG: hypothetical protein Q9M26_07345 [Mariprofundales bacterium]|nr:hypothetical protein [Mariprofundales bacterium]
MEEEWCIAPCLFPTTILANRLSAYQRWPMMYFAPDWPQLCRRTAFSIIEMHGDRVDDYLQGQITQDIALLTPDALCYAALLTPQGKTVSDLWIAINGETRLIIVPQATLEATCTRLQRFSIGFTLSITPAPQWQLWSLQGAGSNALARGMASDTTLAFSIAEASDDGVWILCKDTPMLDAKIIEESTMEAARICYGTPRFGIDWSNFPLNANLGAHNGISFDKGCYVGQEVTSRMHWRGGVRKQLCHWQLEAMPNTLPAAITTTVAVGQLTSAAQDAQQRNFGIGQIAMDAKDGPLTLNHANALSLLGPAGYRSK